MDINVPVVLPYEAPVLQRVGEFVDLAAQLEKHGVSGSFPYVVGEYVDWSRGRVS